MTQDKTPTQALSPEITPAVTEQAARLARLALSPEELATFTSQIGEIIRYVTQLQEVNVEDIEPMFHPFALATPLREDQVIPPLCNEEGRPKVLDSALEVLNDGYQVPPIL